MDLVYVHKRTGDDRELLYSLRSACANLLFDRVIVVGQRPRFDSNVIHIPFKGPANRYDNSFSKTMEAAKSEIVSEAFIHMNDDFYILKPFDEVPHLYMTTIGEWIAAYSHRRRGGEYLEKARRTMAITGPDAKFFETHFPFVYEKSKLIALTAKYKLPCRIMPRTLYGFEYKITGERSDDFKAKTRGQIAEFADKPFMSTDNQAARTPEFRKLFERLFPKPCRYELEYGA